MESDDDVIFTFSVISQFSRSTMPCSGFRILSVPKQNIQQYFTYCITLERTTQAYITNIIVDEVAMSLFVLLLI